MADISSLQIDNNSYNFKDLTARSGLADKQDIIQKTTLPTASSAEEGHIYQYIGATGNGLTNGYFYKCVNNDGTYEWVAISVQNGGGVVVLDRTCTLAANAWVGNDVPYTQTANVVDIVATDKAFCDVSVSSTVATGMDEIDDWALISKIESGAGTMTFSCYEDKPTTDLTVNIKVVR